MMNGNTMNRSKRFTYLLVLAGLVLALVAAAFPQPVAAQSSTNCRTFHVVREGETTGQISHTYGLRWKAIARANDMNPAARPKVGDRLCIPSSSDSSDPSGPLTNNIRGDVAISVNNGAIRVETDNFNNASVFIVKVRNASTGAGGWTKLGRMSVSKNEAERMVFNVPESLSDAGLLYVCLKNQVTDELFCRTVGNS